MDLVLSTGPVMKLINNTSGELIFRRDGMHCEIRCNIGISLSMNSLCLGTLLDCSESFDSNFQ